MRYMKDAIIPDFEKQKVIFHYNFFITPLFCRLAWVALFMAVVFRIVSSCRGLQHHYVIVEGLVTVIVEGLVTS